MYSLSYPSSVLVGNSFSPLGFAGREVAAKNSLTPGRKSQGMKFPCLFSSKMCDFQVHPRMRRLFQFYFILLF